MGVERLGGQRQLLGLQRGAPGRSAGRPRPRRQRPGWPCALAAITPGSRPLGRAGEDEVGGEPLVQVGLLGRPAAVAVLDLAVGPGHVEGPRHVARLAAERGEDQRLVAVAGHRRGEGDHRRAARLEVDPAADAEDRVEHGAGRPRERRARVERRRRGRRPAPAEEPRPVGLELRRAGPGVGRRDVHGPDRLLVVRPRPPPRQDRPDVGQPLGLEEQLVERRVGQVGPARAEHDLGVAGHVELARRSCRSWSGSPGGSRRRARGRR